MTLLIITGLVCLFTIGFLYVKLRQTQKHLYKCENGFKELAKKLRKYDE